MTTLEDNIKIILADWLDALRRHDFDAIERRMAPDVFWQGIREDFVCADRSEAMELLRYVRGSPEVAHPQPRAVGIDDWAFRRGRRYGTMIVDLERHEVIDLLEDREAGAVRAWLERHPQIRIVARDRGGAYAEAATKGAPQAMQVADRWHLMHNLAGALEEFLLHKKKVLREAARTETRSPEGDYATSFSAGSLTPNRARIWYEKQLDASRKRHERIVEQWKDIRRLHLAGADVHDIAKRLGVSRETVYRYRRMEEPPEPVRFRHKKRVLDPYVPYILRRWEEGCRNGTKLYREIREQGYAYGASNVARLVAELRRARVGGGGSANDRTQGGVVLPDKASVPTARQGAALFLKRREKLTAEQEAYLDRLGTLDRASADWCEPHFPDSVHSQLPAFRACSASNSTGGRYPRLECNLFLL